MLRRLFAWSSMSSHSKLGYQEERNNTQYDNIYVFKKQHAKKFQKLLSYRNKQKENLFILFYWMMILLVLSAFYSLWYFTYFYLNFFSLILNIKVGRSWPVIAYHKTENKNWSFYTLLNKKRKPSDDETLVEWSVA